MILKLVIIVQMWSAIDGAGDLSEYIRRVQINATCSADKVKVTNYFEVEKYCFIRCKNKTKNWWEKTTEDFNDERLCNPFALFCPFPKRAPPGIEAPRLPVTATCRLALR
uniref:Putative salivary kunitz domain protein n=1 Tax=Ixodes ricinus TaxID=34613 RepID=A0A6B0UIU0_IXORI